MDTIFNLTELKRVSALQQFAAGHDWLLRNTENGVLVKMPSMPGDLFPRKREFTDLKELRTWAGY